MLPFCLVTQRGCDAGAAVLSQTIYCTVQHSSMLVFSINSIPTFTQKEPAEPLPKNKPCFAIGSRSIISYRLNDFCWWWHFSYSCDNWISPIIQQMQRQVDTSCQSTELTFVLCFPCYTLIIHYYALPSFLPFYLNSLHNVTIFCKSSVLSATLKKKYWCHVLFLTYVLLVYLQHSEKFGTEKEVYISQYEGHACAMIHHIEQRKNIQLNALCTK